MYVNCEHLVYYRYQTRPPKRIPLNNAHQSKKHDTYMYMCIPVITQHNYWRTCTGVHGHRFTVLYIKGVELIGHTYPIPACCIGVCTTPTELLYEQTRELSETYKHST